MAKRIRFYSTSKITSEDIKDAYDENQVWHESTTKVCDNNTISNSQKDSNMEVQEFNSRCHQKNFSKNAVRSRNSRKKKKRQLTRLKKKLRILKQEKHSLVGIIDYQSFTLFDLRKEVRYLKEIIANRPENCEPVRNTNSDIWDSVPSLLNNTSKVCTNDTREEILSAGVIDDCLSYGSPFDSICLELDPIEEIHQTPFDPEEFHQIPFDPEEYSISSQLLEHMDYGMSSCS